MKAIALFLFVGLALVSPIHAEETYIVDTGSGWPQFGVSIYNRTDGDVQFNAGQFSIDRPYTISSLEAWMYSVDPGTVDLVLYGDSMNLPDKFNEILRSTLSVASPGPVTLWQGVRGLDLSLSAGSYWIALEKPSAVDGFQVNLPSGAPHPLARYAYFDEDTNGEWTGYTGGQGFRVGVVPEPASMVLFSIGGVALAAFRSRKKKLPRRFSNIQQHNK